jgi:hypothetical protein
LRSVTSTRSFGASLQLAKCCSITRPRRSRAPHTIYNQQLRAQINNYFRKLLPKRPKREDERNATVRTILQFPEVIDYFIKYKEERGSEAESISLDKVAWSELLYLHQFKQLPLSGHFKTGQR